MRGALYNNIDGIIGECGGALACATCHVYVDEAWFAKVGARSEMEGQMLDFSPVEVKPNSRLSCQLTMSAELDGLVVRMPDRQY
jgi:2Fe-2S ferredoxin